MGEDPEHTKDSPPANPEEPSGPPISQKRSHEPSTSNLEKETLPYAQNGLQSVLAHPSNTDWVKVSKKKGKKCRLEASTHSG